MKKFLLACLVVPMCCAFGPDATAQTKKPAARSTTKKPAKKPVAKSTAPSPTVKPVYYPDFYTFYDPASKNYVYWQDTSWAVDMQKPAFMRTADDGKVRVQILHDESMQNHPEDRFDQYMKLYPPMNTMPGVTVPIITIDRKPRKQAPVE